MPGDALAMRRSSLPETLGGYRLGDELGRGSMSVVYRATRDGVDYAVKVMRPSTSASALDLSVQFRREAAAVARLRHDALVQVVEAGVEAGLNYLVMELAEGAGLDRHLEQGGLDDDRVIHIARALAGALIEVHRGGLVHRDIKPANIVMSDTGQVKLIDFGMVTDDEDADEVAGTPHYAPPEQLGILNRAIAAPSDLYALGATLFECLTGSPPFQADTHADLLHRVATEPARTLVQVRPQTRPALSEIVQHLLHKDPDDRYQSAAGLLADLDRLDALDADLRADRPITLQTEDRFSLLEQQTPLIGRKRSLDALSAAWRESRSGRLTFVKILGEGGSGKTRLAQQVLSEAQDDDAFIMVGKCQENEGTPFGPLREAVERHLVELRRLPDPAREEAEARLREAAGLDAPLLKRLSPGLSRILGEVGERRALDGGAEQQRYFKAVAGFIAALARPHAPLVLVLDDVQWIDPGSVEVLSALAARRGDVPVLVIATSRPTSSPITADYDTAVEARSAGSIELGPLSRGEVGELVAAHLGGRPLDDETTDRLAEVTHGNPFAVGEYLRALLDRGLIRPTGEGWMADMEAIRSVDLPDDVVELVIGRLDDLDPATASLAELAALSGGRFSVELLTTVSARNPAAVQRGLSELAKAGLVGPGFDGTWSFHHDRAREAILEGIPEARQRDVHQAIAEALDGEPDPSPATLYALARHYASGRTDRAAERVATANLEAGLCALGEHAYDNAFQMLDTAWRWAGEADTREGLADRLLPALGRACAMTGRLERAFEHLHDALPYASTTDERFRIHHLLTLTYASQGRNAEALEALYQSFEVLGRPFPQSRVMQIAQLVPIWILAIVLRMLGIGQGSARGRDRERRKTLSQLHYAGSMIAMFEGDALLMGQFIVRDFYNVHFLGASAETAIASTFYGAAMGLAGLRPWMEHHTSSGVAMAEQLGDRAALAVCHAYEACGHKWVGDLDHGNQLMSTALPELEAHVPGSWYSAMMIGEHGYSLVQAGRTREAAEHVRRYTPEVTRTNNLMFSYNTASIAYMMNMIAGDVQTAQARWEQLEQSWPALSKTNYVQLAKSVALLEVYADRNVVGPEVQEAIDIYEPVQGEDYYSNHFRMGRGYARLVALEHGPAEDRTANRAALKHAIRALGLRALVPLWKVHPVIWSAALARLDGRWRRAERLLRRAQDLAGRLDNPRAEFHIALERALLAEARGEPTVSYFAEQALQIATRSGWKSRILQVRQRFDLAERPASQDPSQTRLGTQALPRELDQAKRYADALLQVSLASASTLDGDEQAHQALTAVSRVLGAERALFFLFDDQQQLVLRASTAEDAATISRTIIRQVAQTGEPVVYTGDASGTAVDGSESILTHGLRSIMAAPLLLRDKLIGVVYLDSRLARGIFTDADVNVLLGVCNHIAIAVETARAARVEAERSVMQKDLELVGAVQSLMLPASPLIETDRLSAVGFYQSATQCGGDWWWSETLEDGSIRLWIGDVSGHGAAPAMVTSSVAGAFRALRRAQPDATPAEILARLDVQVGSLGGRFHMTMTAVRIDGTTGRVEVWNAGGPPIFVMRNQDIEALTAPGTVLGHGEGFTIGRAVSQLDAGDRLLLCTDGVLELKNATGRDLGARGLARLLRRAADQPFDDVPEWLAETLNTRLGEREQDDDITFVFAQSNPPSA